jgi:hypothetical protein
MFSRNLGLLVLAAAIALVLLAAAACERASNTPRPAAASTLPPAVSASMARLLPSVPADCPVTSFASASPPGQTVFTPTWYGSEETPLWAGLSRAEMGKWFAGQPQKVGWWQPRGRLEIAGRSLDGTARRFSLQDHQVYGPGFNPSIVRVPRAGCWEIVGRAGGAELRFVVYAFPSEFAPPLESGRTIAEQVRVSDLVVRAVAGEPLVSDAGFVLHPLKVETRVRIPLGLHSQTCRSRAQSETKSATDWRLLARSIP